MINRLIFNIPFKGTVSKDFSSNKRTHILSLLFTILKKTISEMAGSTLVSANFKPILVNFLNY
jgi:hypothetical protein